MWWHHLWTAALPHLPNHLSPPHHPFSSAHPAWVTPHRHRLPLSDHTYTHTHPHTHSLLLLTPGSNFSSQRDGFIFCRQCCLCILHSPLHWQGTNEEGKKKKKVSRRQLVTGCFRLSMSRTSNSTAADPCSLWSLSRLVSQGLGEH